MGSRMQPPAFGDAPETTRELFATLFGEGVDPGRDADVPAADGVPAELYAVLSILPGPAIPNFHRMISRAMAPEGRPLPAPLRELAALRTAVVADCRSVFMAHLEIARQVGVSEEKIAAVKGWTTSDVYDDVERAVMAAADELTSQGRIQDETIAALKLHLSDAAIAEVVYDAAMFDMVSTLTRGLELADDTGMADRLVEVPKASA
jgi:AhpD family alkylhydroperoxidase